MLQKKLDILIFVSRNFSKLIISPVEPNGHVICFHHFAYFNILLWQPPRQLKQNLEWMLYNWILLFVSPLQCRKYNNIHVWSYVKCKIVFFFETTKLFYKYQSAHEYSLDGHVQNLCVFLPSKLKYQDIMMYSISILNKVIKTIKTLS